MHRVLREFSKSAALAGDLVYWQPRLKLSSKLSSCRSRRRDGSRYQSKASWALCTCKEGGAILSGYTKDSGSKGLEFET